MLHCHYRPNRVAKRSMKRGILKPPTQVLQHEYMDKMDDYIQSHGSSMKPGILNQQPRALQR
jgi:hypothetical protein